MYSPLGLVIFVAVERTFVCFTKSHEHFISNSIRCGCLRTDQCNIACSKAAINRNALAILAVATLLGGIELLLLIYAVRVCRLPSLLALLLLDTLCSKKWYDMPHTGCGIHSRQRSTIPRIGRHSAVYNRHARYKLNNRYCISLIIVQIRNVLPP